MLHKLFVRAKDPIWKALSIVGCLLIAGGCGSSTGTDASVDAEEGGAQAVGGSPSVEVKTNPSEMSQGDILWVDFDAGAGSIDFSGTDSEATFKLILQSALETESAQSLSLGNLSVETKSIPWLSSEDSEAAPDENPAEAFHHQLRVWEESQSLLPPQSVSLSKAMQSPAPVSLNVGDTQSFKVLNSLTSTSSYTTVSATAQCVTDRIAIFVDNRVSLTDADVFLEEDVASLCVQYDRDMVSEMEWYGDHSDVNGDGVVIALMTPAINQLGASGGGIVTGFFYAGDLTSEGAYPSSNQAEIVYLLTPDPNGTYGTPISKSFAMSNLLPAVFPHEVQHLISYYQHVMVAGGSAEEDWLNEAMSHFTEDLVGQGMENPSRYNLYLQSPSSYSIVSNSSPNLSERGGGYLFLRYLYEQADDATGFLRNLLQTNLRGVANLEAAFGGTASDFNTLAHFLRRFGVAVALTNQGVTTDSRFVFADRTQNSTTGNYEGACLVCNAEDNRGTMLTGPAVTTFYGAASLSVAGTGTRVVDLSSFPENLTIIGSSDSELQGVLIRVE